MCVPYYNVFLSEKQYKEGESYGIRKSQKRKNWTKILLGGSSGSGKTYSALRLATGLAKKCGSGIAAIDTEAGRIRYYANEFDFSYMQLTEPFTPEKYIEAINDAVDSGFKVLIIDSISHEWNYCVTYTIKCLETVGN